MSGPEWHEALLAEGTQPVLLLDREGRVRACSRALAEALGSSREVIAGLALSDLIDGAAPATPGVTERLVREAPQRAELALSTPGEPRWMELRSLPVRGGTLILLRDTDAERATGSAETLVATLGRRLPGVMWMTDRDLIVTGILGGGLAMQNRSRDELMGTHVFDYFGTHEVDEPPVAAHHAALRGETGEYEIERSDRRFHARVEPIEEDGEVVGVVGLALEVNDPAALAVRLRGAQREQTIGRLAGSIAHEFNNLLTVIAAHAALLEDPAPSDSRLQDLAAIQEATTQGRLLTSRLLSLTRRQIRQPRRVRVDQTLAELEPMLTAILGERRGLVVASAPAPAWVTVDPALLEQVLLSLVDNARHATDEEGHVTVGSRVVVDERTGAEWVEIEVGDDGVGMPDSVRARATEAFFTTRSAGQGTGLGLTNALSVVRGANGVLRIDSALGSGTSVTLRLPRAKAPSGVRRIESSNLTETILLVEDQLGVRRAARRILRRVGYRVFEAAHGEDALAIATTYPGEIHVLVTDVVMPGMSGPELATALLEQRPDVAVLYMSGYAEDVDAVRSAIGRGQTFLAKPFSPEDLLRRVREALGEGGEEDDAEASAT